MRAVIRSAALVAGHVRDLVVIGEIMDGPAALTWLGFPRSGKQDRQERVLAAVANSGLRWPSQRNLTVTASPGGLPDQSGHDLAVAVAVLAAAWEIPVTAPDGMAFYAGLDPDGFLVPVPGVLPAVAAAAARGCSAIVVAAANAAEARVYGGVTVVPADRLADVARWLSGGPVPDAGSGAGQSPLCVPDMADVQCCAPARLAAEVAAAGGHHLMLLGPPHPAKQMLAERIPGIMPALGRDDVLAVTGLHSLAGTLAGTTLATVPPFAALDDSAAPADVAGVAGRIMRPGAVSLAHLGVLFLREAPRLSPGALDALREPFETSDTYVSHAGITARFPARFLLTAAASPCPCTADGGTPDACTCGRERRRAYLRQVPAWLTDRLSLRVTIAPGAAGTRQPGESTAAIAARVTHARERASWRLRETPWQLNSEIPGPELIRRFPPEPGACEPIEYAAHMGRITDQAIADVLRVAWTLADLNSHPRPTRADCSAALGFRTGDIR